jgi:hypothetical protein
MTPARLLAIGMIFVGTAMAWAFLGQNVVSRSGEKDYGLRQEVEQLWGGHHVQRAPSAWWTDDAGNAHALALTASDVDVELALEHRKKGLLWFATYGVAFAGEYRVKNTDALPRDVAVHFAFPAQRAIYDGFVFRVNDEDAVDVTDLKNGAVAHTRLSPGDSAKIEIGYRSRGIDAWEYVFGPDISNVRDFSLDMKTDFDAVDFPARSLSPTTLERDGEGAALSWRFDSLVTGQRVALELPKRLNPGPLVSRISFFAPVSLLFFFTVMVILGVMRERSLHPMNYFFLATAFFAFHLLLAYLVDHLDIHASFAIAGAVSVFLVVSYLRIVAGTRFAVREAGLAQTVFLLMFSYAFFYEGKTGLAVVIGSVATLFVLMQLTARVDWSEVFGGGDRHRPSGSPVAVPGVPVDDGAEDAPA